VETSVDPPDQHPPALFGHQIRWYFAEHTLLFAERYPTTTILVDG
jgi:hypothetical protein